MSIRSTLGVALAIGGACVVFLSLADLFSTFATQAVSGRHDLLYAFIGLFLCTAGGIVAGRPQPARN